MTINVTRRSATAMLTKRNPVCVLVSGFFVIMRIRDIFPINAMSMVMQYKTVKDVVCNVLKTVGSSPVKEI